MLSDKKQLLIDSLHKIIDETLENIEVCSQKYGINED